MQAITKEQRSEESGRSEGGDKEESRSSVDSGSALQAYLNSISISSFPHIRGSTEVLELKAEDPLKDAIHKLHRKNASVALITDNSDTNIAGTTKLSDRYIGVISFASMVLWCMERLLKDDSHHSEKENKTQVSNGFFSRLDQNPLIKQTKVADLAKLFLWDPFFPVHLEDDTLFHVLLLLSNHRLEVVPVIERSKNQVIGIITQNAVVKLLLQSNGLEWFDNLGNVALSEFRFETKNSACQLYADQSISEALLALSRSRVGAVAVVDRKTKELVGTVRNGDVSVLLDNDQLFANSKAVTLAQFIKIDTDANPQRNDSILRMDSPVVHNETTILKQAMTKMAETNSESSFLVDEMCHVKGMLTLRDVIVEFAPPCVDSRINGGGFFESVLQQTGCHVENGTMVSDQ